MKKIVVTGVAGFIGSNLARKLMADNYEVLGIDNLSGGTQENVPQGVDFHLADIRSPEIAPLFAETDTVFHLAAMTNLPACLKDPVAASDVNVTGTVKVLECARQAKVRKFIYADTSAEYEGIYELPAKVDKVCPISAYAVSKHGGALFCEIYRKFLDLNVTVVRYFNVYGPVQDWQRVFPPVVSSFATKLVAGTQPTIYGTGEKRRDFIYVDDVNDFHILILKDDRSNGRIYNVGTGKNYSVVQIFDLIEAQLKTGLKPHYQPDLPGEAEATLADITDGLELGWRPQVGIEEGLQRSIDYYRDQIAKAGKLATGR